MEPFTTSPTFEPPPPLPPPPPGPPYRLRLWHFFLWTFASALIAAVTRRPEYMRELTPADERSYLFLTGVYGLISGPFVAASLWFFVIAIPRRLFFGKWLPSSLGSQPGHWLLLIGGMETLAGLSSYYLSAGRGGYDNGPELLLIWGPAYLAGMILAFFAWNRCTKDKTISAEWSVLFWSGAVVRMVCCFGNPWFLPLMFLSGRVAMLRGIPVLSGEFAIVVTAIALVLLGAAVLSDVRGNKQRDAFHWLGVAATLSIFTFPMLWCLLLPPGV